jgi:GNAT superfamily N-acetyltransferase
MPSPLFLRADPHSPAAIHDALQGLQAEYLAWVHREMTRWLPAGLRGGPPPQEDGELLRALTASRPPGGVLYLIEVDGEAAGMCGLRNLGGHVAEVKRLYVRPAYRGLRLGSAALQRLLADACLWGCTRICLDTAHFMRVAHALYETHGFTDCAAYDGTEVPAALHGHWRFMQRASVHRAP